jgi:hypothetical protein
MSWEAARMILGRERELEAIDAIIDGVVGGASALLLEGEAESARPRSGRRASRALDLPG